MRSNPEERGVIPNSFEHIFTHIDRTENEKYLVRVSYLEIYQEEIRDLLSKDHKSRLELREKPDTGIYVKVEKEREGERGRGREGEGRRECHYFFISCRVFHRF